MSKSGTIPLFVVSDNQYINANFIRWFKEVNGCFYVCSQMNGCSDANTVKVCKDSPSFNYFRSITLMNNKD